MEHLRCSLPFVVFLLCMIPLIPAMSEQVLSTVIYTHHGERTPMVWTDDPSLTPLGARQLWEAGGKMRDRYVQSTSFGYETSYAIRDIQGIFLKNREISILTSTEEWVTGSAQAFMQGLYPPLTDGQNYTNIEGESDLANGTNIIAPLGGYQYPNIAAASPYDLRSVFVQGADNCPQYNLDMIEYYNSSRYQAAQQSSQDFYDSLKAPFLNGIFEDSTVGYNYAYDIWDYLSYASLHNTTVARKLSIEDSTEARLLAGNWMLDMYANTTNGKVGQEHILAIAGRTFAYYIMQSFLTSIETQGRDNKINLVFGDYKPMMSFAALAQLMEERTSTFFYAPAPGASFIFELFTMQADTTNLSYPQSSDMFVRFFYQDGNSTDPIEYPLFGQSPSQSIMTYGEFADAMSGIMISDIEDWCQTCLSNSIFCLSTSQASQTSSTNHHGLQPAVAGVIGAIVALAFIALLIGLIMVFGGIRLHKQGKRTSQLGGFKGNEKLASDQDLTVPKGGAGVTVHQEPRGHERVGSWELKEPVNAQNIQSGIDTAVFAHQSHGLDEDDTVVDPYAVPVKPHDTF